MGKKRMSSASTSVFYPLAHPQIRTSSFYHRPKNNQLEKDQLKHLPSTNSISIQTNEINKIKCNFNITASIVK